LDPGDLSNRMDEVQIFRRKNGGALSRHRFGHGRAAIGERASPEFDELLKGSVYAVHAKCRERRFGIASVARHPNDVVLRDEMAEHGTAVLASDPFQRHQHRCGILFIDPQGQLGRFGALFDLADLAGNATYRAVAKVRRQIRQAN
jgi:hypothetical protein